MKVANRGGLNVFLAQYFHFDRGVGEIEGKVVQEVGHVGRCPVHHRQGVQRCTFGLLSKGQVQELMGEALHLSRTEGGQLVGVGVQDSATAVGLPLLVHEASEPGACLKAGAAYVVVLMGQEGGAARVESVEIGGAAVRGLTVGIGAVFVLHSCRQRRVRANERFEVSSEPFANSLNCFAVHVSDLLSDMIVLTVLPLLLLF